MQENVEPDPLLAVLESYVNTRIIIIIIIILLLLLLLR